jgi:crotonobetainyl-CoA:carnitine CoA-transferase CaiB-like acyl-CoA transferase
LSGSTRADSLSRSPAGLLDGVTVIDLSMFVAGPFATMTLADLGARVIKVEPLAGDPVRRSGIGPQLRGEAAQFQSYNRNKFSIAVDLKADRGRAVILDLARHADAVFDNFRPGVLDRLGLGYEALRAVNPGIVSASLSAFGADGPWSTRPGYDIIVQALSGAMSLIWATRAAACTRRWRWSRPWCSGPGPGRDAGSTCRCSTASLPSSATR